MTRKCAKCGKELPAVPERFMWRIVETYCATEGKEDFECFVREESRKWDRDSKYYVFFDRPGNYVVVVDLTRKE